MGNGTSSTAPGSVSANGQYEVFTSTATDLVSGVSILPFSGYHVYLRNLSTGTTSLIDVAADGTTSGTDSAMNPSLTPDGRYTAFRSRAHNLTANGTNPADWEVYVRDLLAGQTFLVSLGTDGNPANRVCDVPSIAEDGQGHLFLAYGSFATNLTTGNSNSTNEQIFLTTFTLDASGAIQYGSLSTKLVSADNTGTGNGGNGDSLKPLLSQDGSMLVFNSKATNLNVPGGYNDNDPYILNLYLYSPTNQILRLLSAEPTPDGITTTVATGNMASDLPGDNGLAGRGHQSISADGRYAVFTSNSDNLVPGLTAVTTNVYLRDLVNGTTSLVSISSDGTSGGDLGSFAISPVITPDGRYVAFTSDAINVTSQSNGGTEVYVRDMQQGQTYLVSLGIDGKPANLAARVGSIAETGNGQLVIAYGSQATNLTANDTSTHVQLFVATFNLDASGNIESDTLSTQLASASSSGNGGNDDSLDPILSRDGSTLAFESLAADLAGETPDNTDGRDHIQVFTFNIASGTLTQVSPTPPAGDTGDSSWLSSMSDNGQYLTYDYQDSMTGVAQVLAWDANAGTNTVIYTNQNVTYPVLAAPFISGDGSTVAFPAGDVFGHSVIYTADNWQSGNPNLTQISPTPSSTNNVWSSGELSISENGQVITYVRQLNSGPDQVYVYNNGTTIEITQAIGGGDGNGASEAPAISADGSTVVFDSQASNLVGGMLDFIEGQDNVFADNVAGNTISLASVQGSGVYTADADISSVSLSDNGRYVAFASSANDLLGNLPIAPGSVFAEDMQQGVPTVIASNSYAQIYSAVISGDGSTVAFTDNAQLTSIPTNGEQIYSRNWLASDPTTTLVSVNSTGDGGANDYTENPSISDNGQVIAFDSRATNLVGNDPNASHYAQILIRDLGTNTTTLASVNSAGTDGGNNDSTTAVLSADGSTLVFDSYATDLVAGVTVPPTSPENVYAFSLPSGSGSAPPGGNALAQPNTPPAAVRVEPNSSNTAGWLQGVTRSKDVLDGSALVSSFGGDPRFAAVDQLFSERLGPVANWARNDGNGPGTLYG